MLGFIFKLDLFRTKSNLQRDMLSWRLLLILLLLLLTGVLADEGVGPVAGALPELVVDGLVEDAFVLVVVVGVALEWGAVTAGDALALVGVPEVVFVGVAVGLGRDKVFLEAKMSLSFPLGLLCTSS